MAPCAALGCKNRHSLKIKGITYHRFPRDPYRQQQWLLAIGRPNWTPNRASTLCSTHFDKHMFVVHHSLTRLKNTAVPTIFEGFPPIENEDMLEFKMEVLDDISNDKNRTLVVPEVQATFDNSANKNNVVVIMKGKKDLQSLLSYGNGEGINGNRAIIVSGRNVKTEWCGMVGYDPNFMEHSQIRYLLSYDPDFYVRRITSLKLKINKLQKKKKVCYQKARRKQKKIEELQKEMHRLKRPKYSIQPTVHVVEK